MAEGTSLLRMHTAYTCIVSSNLTVSAKYLNKSPTCWGFFSPSRIEAPGRMASMSVWRVCFPGSGTWLSAVRHEPGGHLRRPRGVIRGIGTYRCRRRSALVITETELRLMASAAMIGDSNWPVNG